METHSRPSKVIIGGYISGVPIRWGSITYIIESVDSISRDGPDTPVYVIHYKMTQDSELSVVKVLHFLTYMIRILI